MKLWPAKQTVKQFWPFTQEGQTTMSYVLQNGVGNYQEGFQFKSKLLMKRTQLRNFVDPVLARVEH